MIVLYRVFEGLGNGLLPDHLFKMLRPVFPCRNDKRFHAAGFRGYPNRVGAMNKYTYRWLFCPLPGGELQGFLSTKSAIFAPKQAGLSLRPPRSGRKVRTPKCSIAGNARPPQGEDQCNRKDVQFGCSEIGKLYAVKRHVGQRTRVARPCWWVGGSSPRATWDPDK